MSRLLLTNDDGVDRDGLRALRASLLALGRRVTTVAPDTNRSGVARAVTIHEDVELRPLEAGDDPIYSCSGTPVDCVRIGLLSDVAPDAAVVVSGINHGINLGDDIGYSGTIGAAIEAASLGACGVALSQQGDDHAVGVVERGRHGFGLAPVAAAIAVRVARTPAPGCALSVNLPSRIDPARPVQVARPGLRFYTPGWLTSRDTGDGVRRFRPFAGLTDSRPRHDTGDGIDFDVVLAGRIAITPLAVREASAADAAAWLAELDLEHVIRTALAELDPASVVRHPAAG